MHVASNLRTALFLASVLLLLPNPCALAHTDVTAAQARDLIKSTSDLIVADVREPYEYCDAVGHIPGARNYPWNSGVLQARYEELPMDRPILVVCRSGGRSNSAASFLDSRGFSTVYDMLGGMSAWRWETAPCKYASGSGTADDPYRIATAADLIALGESPEDYDKHFILTADIDLGRGVFDQAVIAPDANDAEDGFQGTRFTGVFDGSGHTISHLTVTGGSYLGLFGLLGSGAKVSNLGIEAMNVSGTGGHVGGLAGANGTEGTVSNCYAAGSVTGGDYSTGIGGLCGGNSGTISDCYATPSVSGGDGASGLGGLCGANAVKGTILNCYATGSVTGGDYSGALGGLCGDNWGTVSVCYATASVAGGDNSGGLGGLCGVNTGAVYHCFWDKQTCGTLYSSGGWGMSTADMMTEATYIAWNNGAWVIDEGRDYPRLAWEDTPGAIIAYEYPRNYAGNGEDQPFELDDPEDMVCMSLRPADWNKNFVLVSDIDMSSVIDYRPVGLFTGSLDGQGHIVENLTIDANAIGNSNLLGMFGRIGLGGRVANLSLLDATVIGPDHSLHLGGLCGQNDGTISDCYASATVSGGQYLGGLCGYSRAGTISNCRATGTVTGLSYLGGLCGLIGSRGTVSNCHAIVNVRRDGAGYSPGLGGLVATNFGTISHCHATGSVTGGNNSEDLGGLAGENAGGGTISNCYATASVTGGNLSSRLGGLCGNNQGTISNCYAIGSVTGGMWGGIGGLCGANWGEVTASFWDVESTGQATSNGGTGTTTPEMQDPNTFMEAGWDFVGQPDGPHDIWAEPVGGGYPVLWWQLSPLPELPFSGGTGEPDDPYLISTANELNGIGHNPRLMTAHFKLLNDIDLRGIDFYAIGDELSPFTGVFDGNGRQIYNFANTSADTDHVGLFSCVRGENAEIRSLGLTDPKVDAGTGDCVGSLVGWLSEGTVTDCYAVGGRVSGRNYVGGLTGDNGAGTITNCYAATSVTGAMSGFGGLCGRNDGTISHCNVTASVRGGNGSSSLGGLCGVNWGDGTVSNCYATGSVAGGDGSALLGGLSGGNLGAISDCYATASVTGRENSRALGGLVGSNLNTIANCYSTGGVSGTMDVGGLIGSESEYGTPTVMYCFWDTETSAQTASAGGIGKTTAEMQTAATFLDAGWDFVDETANGADDIWWILEGQDYPRLWWEAEN